MSRIKPRINKSLHIEKIEGEKLLLLSDEKKVVLEKSDYTHVLLQVAENRYTFDQLLEKNADSIPPHIFFSVYETLLEKKMIVHSDCTLFSDEQSAFWEAHGYEAERVADIVAKHTISVRFLGVKKTQAFINSCKAVGLRVTASKSNLHVVIADSYRRADLAMLNDEMYKNNKPWMLIKPTGKNLYVGPVFNGNETACWECFKHRLTLHCPVFATASPSNSIVHKSHVKHLVSENIAYQIAVLGIMHFFYNKLDSQLINNVLLFDTHTLQTSNHSLIKRPQCPVCGSVVAMHPSKMVFDTNRHFTHFLGGYRCASPEHTFEKYKHHISALTGVVPFVTECGGEKNDLIHNFSSGANLALQSTSNFLLNKHLRSNNGGKGKNSIQAKTGALCEAIERYCLVYHSDVFSITGRFCDIKNAIHPNQCMNFSDFQYSQRHVINRQSARYYSLIPEPFDKNSIMEWTPVYSMVSDVFYYLPTSFCYAQYPYKNKNDIISYPDSNGCAAGNTIEEAFLQAFLELVERDAVALWWYNKIRHRQIDIASANNKYITDIVAYYASQQRHIVVLDITSDLGIPVFVALSYSDTTKKQILLGFGCHIDASIALERAIVEMNQLLPIVTDLAIEVKDAVFADWLTNVAVNENEYLNPISAEAKLLSEYVVPAHDVGSSVMYCLNVAKKNNLDVLVLDMTQPDIKLPVVRVFVPSLRHFWKRTAPGRLYDVPVKMGWLNEKLLEHELNPIAFFL